MPRMKMVTVASLAAAVLGAGALAAPAAHAQPNADACDALAVKARSHWRAAEEWGSIGANAAAQRNVWLFIAYWESYKVCLKAAGG